MAAVEDEGDRHRPEPERLGVVDVDIDADVLESDLIDLIVSVVK